MNGCKKCPAFGKCEATYRGSSCSALRHTYGLNKDPEIITNYDHIKAMSVEEMADMISGYADMSEQCNEKFAMCCNNVGCCGLVGTCKPAIKRWLQQEAN